MSASTLARFVDASGSDTAAAIAGVVTSVARVIGVPVELRVAGSVIEPDPDVAGIEIPPDEIDLAHLLPGAAREALMSKEGRHSGGVHHTPFEIASVMFHMATSHGDGAIVADPSVGGGIFLLAAAAAMPGEPAEVVQRLIGCDIDPLAVATTEAALTLWSGGVAPPAGAIRVADFLGADPFGGIVPDLIIGNPPFLSQLRGDTVRDEGRRADLRARWPELGGYVDESVAFLLAAVDLVSDSGTVALLQPTSVLSARDARAARSRLDSAAPTVGFWWAGDGIFDADVDACVVVCRRGAEVDSVQRRVGPEATPAAPCRRPEADSWSPLLAGVAGVPEVVLEGEELSTLADVTAGFRDQYYGLRHAVVDDPEASNPLITSGLIDPIHNRWGSAPCRYDRRKWEAPGVIIDLVDDSVRGWVEQRLRPKLLVATQTRVLEVIVDPEGVMVPCTPVVVVEPRDPAMIWHLAAALMAPATSAVAVGAAAGSGLSADAIRVSASNLASTVLPAPGPAWDEAAESVRVAHESGGGVGHLQRLADLARACDFAYGLHDDLLHQWWLGRLPGRLTVDEIE